MVRGWNEKGGDDTCRGMDGKTRSEGDEGWTRRVWIGLDVRRGTRWGGGEKLVALKKVRVDEKGVVVVWMR